MTKSTTKSTKLEDQISERISNIIIRLSLLIAATIQAVQGHWEFLVAFIVLSMAATFTRGLKKQIAQIKSVWMVAVYVIIGYLAFLYVAWAVFIEVILHGNWVPWALINIVAMFTYLIRKEK